jgi:hypothetical protein
MHILSTHRQARLMWVYKFVGLRYVMASRLHFRTFYIELNPASPADVVRLPQVLED